MFDWIGDLIDAIAEAIREAFEFLGTQISNTIWNTMLRWFYETICGEQSSCHYRCGDLRQSPRGTRKTIRQAKDQAGRNQD